MRTKIATIAGVLALAAVTIACGSGGNDDDPPTGTIPGGNAAEESTGNAPADLKSEITFDDGIVVGVKDFKRDTSSEYASPNNAPMVVFKVSITNGTDKDLDLSLVIVDCAVGADGDQADTVIDSDSGLDIIIEGVVKTGSTKSGKFGCPMPEKETKLQIKVSLNDDLDRQPAVFTGDVPK